jgi:hypothetical protein
MREELGITTAALKDLGKLEMQDEHSLKFVSLFLARSDAATIREPSQISELRYWPIEKIRSRLSEAPGDFTPTFASLFNAFGVKLR